MNHDDDERNNIWTRDLERFIRSRLRDRTGCGSPLVLTNSQYMIEGIALSVDDHPQQLKGSFSAIRNTLESRAAVLRKGVKETAVASLELYLAWCVFDGVSKRTALGAFRTAAAGVLGNLVERCMPLWGGRDCSDRWNAAVLEYGDGYWCIIRSWVALHTFPSAATRECERAVARSLLMAGETAADTVAAKSLPSASEPVASSTKRFPSKAESLSFRQLQSKSGFVCVCCGAPFSTLDARDKHHDFHFALKRRRNEAPFARLVQPTLTAFLGHSGDHEDGSFVELRIPSNMARRVGFTRAQLNQRNQPDSVAAQA